MDSTKIYTAGIEYKLATKVLTGYENCGVNVGIVDNYEVLEINFTPKTGNRLSAQELNHIKNDAIKRLGHNIIDGYKNVQESVVELLKSRSLKLATAESCTSGLISSKITEISGASEVFHYGLSAYSNDIKIKALGVQKSTIDKYGAVSSQTAAQMAIGAMRMGEADIGLSITGVAGPNISEGKPVGLIYIGLCDEAGLWVLKLGLDGITYNREQIRERAANLALDFVRRYLSFQDFGCELYRGDDSYCVTTERLSLFSVDTESIYPLILNNSSRNFNMNIFPCIKDGALNFTRKLLAWVLAILTVVFSFCLVNFFLKEHGEVSLNNAMIKEYNKNSTNNNKYHLNSDGVFEIFANFKKQNDDFYGWISNGNYDTHSPIMLSDDQNFYYNHNFNKKASTCGMISLDSNCNINGNEKSKNIILHGKNNANGLAFGNLDKYLDLSYYKRNPLIKFETLNTKGEYVIFAVAKFYNDDFNYKKTDFTDSEVYEYLEKIYKSSIYTNNINVNHENDFLTLVCDIGTDESLVLFAKNLTDNEELLNLDISMNKQK